MVTAGAQGALHLLAGRLLGPGDVVLVEQPTYPNALEAFRRTGARLVPFPVTGDGWDLDLLAETFASVRPRLAYLQPDFQNPTGALLDTRGRELIVAAARRSGTMLLIDETHAELDLSGQQMPPPTAALERDGQVVTVGSLSKVVWGGLRIGWIRSAPRMIADLVGERSGIDLGGPVLDHLIGAEVLERLPGDSRCPSAVARRVARSHDRRAGPAPSGMGLPIRRGWAVDLGPARRPVFERPRSSGAAPSGTARVPARGSASTARSSASCACPTRFPPISSRRR